MIWKKGKHDGMPHPLDVAMGARLRAVRNEAGITQTELAAACGLTFQQIQKYEKGTNRITFSRLCEIAPKVGLTVEDLIRPVTDAGVDVRNPKPVGGYFVWANEEYAMAMLAQFVNLPVEQRKKMLELAKAMNSHSG